MSLSDNRLNLMKEMSLWVYQTGKLGGIDRFQKEFPDFETWEKRNFANETSVQSLRNALKNLGLPVGTSQSFYEEYVCDLSQFSKNNYCSSTPVPVKPEPVKPEPVKPEPVKPEPVKPEPVNPEITPPDTSCPPAVAGDTSADSPNKKEDPGGGGKIYNIPGDPYKWRIGEDGGWWAKRDSQSKWNNISGQVNRCEKPKWRISIDTMDRKYFNGDATKRVAAKNEVNESNNNTQNSFRLGKFFID